MEVLDDEKTRVLKKVTRWRQWTRVDVMPEEAAEVHQQRRAEKAARAQAKEQAREAEVLSDEKARVLNRWLQWERIDVAPEGVVETQRQRQAEKAVRRQEKEQVLVRAAAVVAAEQLGLTFGAPRAALDWCE